MFPVPLNLYISISYRENEKENHNQHQLKLRTRSCSYQTFDIYYLYDRLFRIVLFALRPNVCKIFIWLTFNIQYIEQQNMKQHAIKKYISKRKERTAIETRKWNIIISMLSPSLSLSPSNSSGVCVFFVSFLIVCVLLWFVIVSPSNNLIHIYLHSLRMDFL